jgi:hypothetical protein
VGGDEQQIDHLEGRIATLSVAIAVFSLMAAVFVGIGVDRFANSRVGDGVWFLACTAVVVRLVVKLAGSRRRLVGQRTGGPMTDPNEQRAQLERARHALQRVYLASAVILVAGLILMTAGHDVGIGCAVLAVDAICVIAAFVGQRAFDSQLRNLDG